MLVGGKNDAIPYHAYATQEHTSLGVSSRESNQRYLLKKVFPSQTLSGDFAGGLSVIENATIRLLPAAIREGYKVAKAMRTAEVLHSILQQLVSLSVADDIHDIVRSYMLKSCVFFITQHAHPDHHNDKLDRVYWCVRIYKKNLKLLYVKDICRVFFSNERLFFRLPRIP